MTSVFRFPLDAPALTGTLLKQGEFGLHLSKKFLILYPGFLVFYDNSDRWTLDVKCGTLSGRSGAVYLKRSKIGETVPGSTKYRYAFSVAAPDVRNKRKNLVLIASNEKEREEWINAITKAIPQAADTKTIIVPPRSPEKQIEATPSTVTCDNGMLQEPACGAAANNLQPQAPQSTSETEEVPKATESDTMQLRNSTGDDASYLSSTLPDVVYKISTPPIVMVRADSGENCAYTGNDGASSVSNLDHGRRTFMPLPHEESTSLGTALQSLSIESLLDIDSRSDCSRSDSGDDCLDDDALVREELGELRDAPEHWLCKLDDRACQWPPDSACCGCPSNNASSGLDDTPLPMGNDTLCDAGHTTCPQSEDSQCRRRDTSCQPTAAGPDNTLADESHCGQHGDNMCKLKDATCMQGSCCQKSSSSTLNGFDSSDDFGSESSRTNKSVSSLLSDSAVFGEDCSEDTFTFGNPSSTAAESSLAGSATDAITASGTDDTVFTGKKGCIFKLNENGRGWNPRYLTIYPGYFCYYKNSSSSKPRDIVKLRNSSVVCTATEKRPYQFSVHTESTQNRRSDWVFAAHGQKAMQEWIAAFQLAGQKPQ
ncbi:hypothetical protein EMCRGX_G024209 [Ephydatia muelleri]